MRDTKDFTFNTSQKLAQAAFVAFVRFAVRHHGDGQCHACP